MKGLAGFALLSITMYQRRSRITSSTRDTMIAKISHRMTTCSCIRTWEAAKQRNSKILTCGIHPLRRRTHKRRPALIGVKVLADNHSLRSGSSLILRVLIRQPDRLVGYQPGIKHLVKVVRPRTATTKSLGSNLRRRRRSPQHSSSITTRTVSALT